MALRNGTTFRGFFCTSEDEDGVPAVVRFGARQAEIDVPVAAPKRDERSGLTCDDPLSQPPAPSWLLEGRQVLCLLDASCTRQTYWGKDISQLWSATRAVATITSRRVDYNLINGMDAELDGLSIWSGVDAIEVAVERDFKNGDSVRLVAKPQETIRLGGELNTQLTNGFRFEDRNPSGFYSLQNLLTLRTFSQPLRPWDRHADSHCFMQDVVSLIFARPCGMTLKQVLREDDQPDFEVLQPDPYTRASAYDPAFGRGEAPPIDPRKHEPLFYLDQAVTTEVERFLSEEDAWRRPLSIASGILFQQDAPAVSRLTQVGVALESLGYSLWKECGSPNVSNTRNGTPHFSRLLKYVYDEIPSQHKSLYGGLDPDNWSQEFNISFRGAKHADKVMPHPAEAHHQAWHGINVIGAWIATRCGVKREDLDTALSRRLDRN